MLSLIRCATLIGIDAIPITAEIDLYLGMPGETIVGLPDTVVKESRNRIKSALKHAGFEFPLRAITINLAPAEIRKEGPLLDLPIAVGILQSSGQLPKDEDSVFAGELSLDGSVKPIRGIVSIVHMAAKLGAKRVIVPLANYSQTRIISGISVVPLANLADLHHVYGGSYTPPPHEQAIELREDQGIDFSEVKGQLAAKRGMEIAAAGKHNILFIGPPGSGKTMLLKRLPTILPELTIDEAIETHKLFSIVQADGGNQFSLKRPFRNPHHTTSYAGLVGGGSKASPGEISLAHNGVLFLDELPEFRRDVLEVLRQPLEDKTITVSRASFKVTYPADFIFTTAMNPCPCGYYGDPVLKCTCIPQVRQKYFKRISGPILDRIDLIIPVPRLKKEDCFAVTSSMENVYTSALMKSRVHTSRERQYTRNGLGIPNAALQPRQMERCCRLDPECERILGRAIDQGMLSGRSYDKVRKVARTIADLAQSESITLSHVCEALQYRNMDLFFQ